MNILIVFENYKFKIFFLIIKDFYKNMNKIYFTIHPSVESLKLNI